MRKKSQKRFAATHGYPAQERKARSNPRRPGKFEVSGGIGELFYAVANEGFADQEEGSTAECGMWYALFEGPQSLAELAENFADEFRQLSAEEKAELREARGGVILSEDSQGFVYVDLYKDERSMAKAWSAVEDEIAECYGEDEDEEL